MKILVLSNMYPPHSLGGYEQSCRDVVERLRARGHEVTVLTTTMRVAGVPDPPAERAEGVRRDLEFYWRDHALLSPPIRQRLRIERGNQQALRDALADIGPDVVSVWNMGAMSLALLTTTTAQKVPLVLVVCDEWLVYGPELDAWTRIFKNRPRLRHWASTLTRTPTDLPDLSSAAFCFISDFIRRRSRDGAPWARGIASVVYSGFDERDFPIASASPRPWRGRLLVVGRLDERKGTHVAVRALAHVPDATLEINGRGDETYRDRLKKLAQEMGVADRVRFEASPRRALRERYAEADVLLFPVLWDEPFGLVPVEAMACGTPVVATGTGGSAEFLADGVNSLIVPPGDDRALADAVQKLSGDRVLRSRLVTGGFETARALTMEKLTNSLEAWHRAAVDRFEHGDPEDRPSPYANPDPVRRD